jgi:hypothetical protein
MNRIKPMRREGKGRKDNRCKKSKAEERGESKRRQRKTRHGNIR